MSLSPVGGSRVELKLIALMNLSKTWHIILGSASSLEGLKSNGQPAFKT